MGHRTWRLGQREDEMNNLNRRAILTLGLLGAQSLIAACGGGGGGSSKTSTDKVSAATPPSAAPPAETPAAPPAAPASAPAPAPAPAPVWNVLQSLVFVAGKSGTVDLNTTLPAGVARGGTFSVDASGLPLPVGTTLSANGLLSIAAAATVGITSGIVFAYSAP